MDLRSVGYGYAGELSSDFDGTIARVKEVLARQGFGVQAEIDISGALKSKLGVDIPREVILGVCNPALAHRAIQAEPEITLLLPCNITVRETPAGTRVAAANPMMLVQLTGNAGLTAIASEADKLLREALSQI